MTVQKISNLMKRIRRIDSDILKMRETIRKEENEIEVLTVQERQLTRQAKDIRESITVKSRDKDNKVHQIDKLEEEQRKLEREIESLKIRKKLESTLLNRGYDVTVISQMTDADFSSLKTGLDHLADVEANAHQAEQELKEMISKLQRESPNKERKRLESEHFRIKQSLSEIKGQIEIVSNYDKSEDQVQTLMAQKESLEKRQEDIERQLRKP